MRILPVKGTSDYTPKEAELREYMENTILNSYKSYGFERIMTPAMEDIENLDKSDGGDNLNLIFKILKRGDKLSKAMESKEASRLADLGLRYDLTLPLSRFYANNKQNLPQPFKCIQIDKVYRAERPQKGRNRELVQCDIDIIGSDSTYCEVELIDATAKALLNLGLKNFKIKINDRKILKEVLLLCGFEDKSIPSVCVTFDKLDKIGADGIAAELNSKGFSSGCIGKLNEFLSRMPIAVSELKGYCMGKQSISDLESVMRDVALLSDNEYKIEFDLSLVRGQGYYTGTIFEIESEDFNSSIAGGGRYDNLIGKFTGDIVPAVGFSIGFERIYCVLKENDFKIPYGKKRIAVIYKDDYCEAAKIANGYRKDYDVTVIKQSEKPGKLISSLVGRGFYGLYVCGKSKELEILKVV